jgi:enterochelin esterase-like enzyme
MSMRASFVLLFGGTLLVGAAAEPQPGLTPQALQEALAAKLSNADAEQLAARIRGSFGKENLKKWPNPKIDELAVAWAVEAPAAATPPQIVSDNGKFKLPLKRLGNTDVYAAAASLPEGTGMRWHYEIGGTKLGGGPLEVYRDDPDLKEKPGVPRGEVKEMPKWESKIFPGTIRDWWVYVPAQYKADRPACVMVFQDGGGYKQFVPTVFDNLIAKGEMPVTVGVFIQPGLFKEKKGKEGKLASNRSFEYDTLSDQYARFLLEEILPEVEKTVKLRHDAASRAIAGISSGGICAFTVAWERPNDFSKVLSWVGSFTNIAHGSTMREGGHNYQALIRKTKPKPLRVFLQDGENDLDNANGNWPLANQEMARSLAFAGYDYKFVYGHGFHSNKHGRAILPDSLRWLWRDYKP